MIHNESRGGTSLEYMPRLDGLRAVAVIAVLVEHFIPSDAIRDISPGGAGVTLFFVLSGYLITRILIKYAESQASLAAAAVQFYWRRFLRLSPPFFVAIAVAALLGLSGMRENWLIHGLYLTNLKIGLSGHWGTGADHFWSLCTEEQFYLLWFLVAVALPRRHLVPVILLCFAITLVFRVAVFGMDWSPLSTVLLPGNLVSLTMGALLAQAENDGRLAFITRTASNRKFLLASGLLFFAVSVSLPSANISRVVFYPFAGALFFGALVFTAAQPGTNKALDWLCNGPLRQIGKISYGIFVYHMFLPEILRKLPLADQIFDGTSWLGFVLLCLVSVLVAWISWVFMEEPVLRYKNRLKWQPSSRPREV